MNAHPHELARLRHRPADLPPDLLEALRRHRGAVLGLLGASVRPPGAGGDPLPRDATDDARYVLGERLGVADELGSPSHPGSAAWLVAVGEALESAPMATYT